MLRFAAARSESLFERKSSCHSLLAASALEGLMGCHATGLSRLRRSEFCDGDSGSGETHRISFLNDWTSWIERAIISVQ